MTARDREALEEALACVLVRVQWYVARRRALPRATSRALAYLMGKLDKSHIVYRTKE